MPRTQSALLATFEEIETDPELNLKRVIAGKAQNKIFLCPNWFNRIWSSYSRTRESGKREKGEVVVENEDRENNEGKIEEGGWRSNRNS